MVSKSRLVVILVFVTRTSLTRPFNSCEGLGLLIPLTVYSAALRVVGIATCVRMDPPLSSLMKCKISFEASIGEPPPTEIIVSASRSLKACTPLLISAIGLRCLISEKVPP